MVRDGVYAVSTCNRESIRAGMDLNLVGALRYIQISTERGYH
jgi:hypothetical protein